MKTKLFLDFDGTIFNTKRFKEEIFSIFKRAGFNQSDIEKTYTTSCIDYCYSIDEHFARLLKIREINPRLTLARIESVFKNTQKYLYDDSIVFLENVDRNRYYVNLLTLGNTEFQKKKFLSTGIGKYFDQEYYTPIQKWDYFEKESPVDRSEYFVIIDDRGDTLERISKKYKKSLAIEINREKNPTDPMEKDNGFKGIVVRNLKQAEKYL